MLPHLRTNLLAHAAGVLAGAGEAGIDGVWVFLLEGDELHDRVAVGFLVELVEEFLVFEGVDDRSPVLAHRRLALAIEVEHELEVDLQQTGVVLGPLDVAAHPQKAVGDAA